MNLREELELLIRRCYPVLSIISSKETRLPAMFAETAGTRPKQSSNGSSARRRTPSTVSSSSNRRS